MSEEGEAGQDRGIVYVQTSGPENVERLYALFNLAQTAKAMGIDIALFFMMRGLLVLKKDVIEGLGVEGFPPIRKMVDDTMSMGIPIYVCDHGSDLLGVERGNYVDGVHVVGAATLNDLAVGYGTVITF